MDEIYTKTNSHIRYNTLISYIQLRENSSSFKFKFNKKVTVYDIF